MSLRLKLLAEDRASSKGVTYTPPTESGEMRRGPERDQFRDLSRFDHPGIHEVRMGRHPDNDVQLPFAGISAVHARLFRKVGLPANSQNRGASPGTSQWWLEDLGSSNGTWLGSTRLQPGVPHLLIAGDQVRLAGLVVVVETVSSSLSTATSGPESTATLGRRLINDGFAPVAVAVTVAPPDSSPASKTPPPSSPPAVQKPARPSPSIASSRRQSSNHRERTRRADRPARPAGSGKRIAVMGFAIAMTVFAVSGLITLALSLR